MTIQLPKLPYEKGALAPFISEKTLEFHYGKHHQAYVNNLNNLVPGTPFESAALEEIIMKSTGGIYNNAAQVWNHTFYWECLRPGTESKPVGQISELITKHFKTYDGFKEQFTKACATLFGAGWAWLVINASGELEIVQESNAGNPMTRNLKPLLTCDVWEHAYYIDYQNRRPDYIASFWQLVNWDKVNSRLV